MQPENTAPFLCRFRWEDSATVAQRDHPPGNAATDCQRSRLCRQNASSTEKTGIEAPKGAVFFHQRTQMDPLIVLERTLFREGQREDENLMLLADTLLFFDESNFRQNDSMINNTLPGELPTCLHD